MKGKNEKIIINLGCGKTRIPGSIGVDVAEIEDYVDVVHDLNKVPYPFGDNYADEIHFYHVLEHLDDPVRKMEEINRILKPGGKLFMRVPHFSSMGAYTDITHVRPFGFLSFDPFEVQHPQHYYTNAEFKILSKEIKYFGQFPNSGVYGEFIHKDQCSFWVRPFVRLINLFIKLSPVGFERLWCYWVGGACEVVVILEKP